MSLMQFSAAGGLAALYVYRHADRLNSAACVFNFNVFVAAFVLTFFCFPLTSVLVFRFDVGAAPPEIFIAGSIIRRYGVYYVTL